MLGGGGFVNGVGMRGSGIVCCGGGGLVADGGFVCSGEAHALGEEHFEVAAVFGAHVAAGFAFDEVAYE